MERFNYHFAGSHDEPREPDLPYEPMQDNEMEEGLQFNGKGGIIIAVIAVIIIAAIIFTVFYLPRLFNGEPAATESDTPQTTQTATQKPAQIDANTDQVLAECRTVDTWFDEVETCVVVQTGNFNTDWEKFGPDLRNIAEQGVITTSGKVVLAGTGIDGTKQAIYVENIVVDSSFFGQTIYPSTMAISGRRYSTIVIGDALGAALRWDSTAKSYVQYH